MTSHIFTAFWIRSYHKLHAAIPSQSAVHCLRPFMWAVPILLAFVPHWCSHVDASGTAIVCASCLSWSPLHFSPISLWILLQLNDKGSYLFCKCISTRLVASMIHCSLSVSLYHPVCIANPHLFNCVHLFRKQSWLKYSDLNQSPSRFRSCWGLA